MPGAVRGSVCKTVLVCTGDNSRGLVGTPKTVLMCTGDNTLGLVGTPKTVLGALVTNPSSFSYNPLDYNPIRPWPITT